VTTTRLSFAIDEELMSDLKLFIPDQLRSEAFRALMRLLIKTQKDSNIYVVDDLINDRLVLQKESENAEAT